MMMLNLIHFLRETEALKTVTRQNKTLDGRFENSAEHSWQLALMALVLRDYFPKTVDMGRVLTMLLVHDLGEIGAGDVSVFDDRKRQTAHQQEQLYVQGLTTNLPDTLRENLFEAWQEFSDGQSAEARYARCIDALAPLMTHLWTAAEGDNPSQLTYSQVLTIKAFIQQESSEFWQLVLALLEDSVARGLYHDDRQKSDEFS